MAQGIRGIIEPGDPLNPYGFGQLKDLDEEDKLAYKKMLMDQTMSDTIRISQVFAPDVSAIHDPNSS